VTFVTLPPRYVRPNIGDEIGVSSRHSVGICLTLCQVSRYVRLVQQFRIGTPKTRGGGSS
jgi:hypothetical protein